MIRFEVLASYSTEENKKKLEDYISEITGRSVDLGPLAYDGKGSILIIGPDLQKISSCNVTGAIHFPQRKFRDVDEFIDWHKNVSAIGYQEACCQVEDGLDVVALYYKEDKNNISYVCFRTFDKQSIGQHLVSSDGKALPFENNGNRYWLLMSGSNGNMLMFRKTGNKEKPFADIRPDDRDLDFFRYLISLKSDV